MLLSLLPSLPLSIEINRIKIKVLLKKNETGEKEMIGCQHGLVTEKGGRKRPMPTLGKFPFAAVGRWGAPRTGAPHSANSVPRHRADSAGADLKTGLHSTSNVASH